MIQELEQVQNNYFILLWVQLLKPRLKHDSRNYTTLTTNTLEKVQTVEVVVKIQVQLRLYNCTSPQMPLLLVAKDDVEPIFTRILSPQMASNTTTIAPSDHQIYKSCDHHN